MHTWKIDQPNALEKYVGRCLFYGRASRREYWRLWLAVIVYYVFLFVVLTAVSFIVTDESVIMALLYVSVAPVLAFLPVLLGTSVRRLHDTGLSGAWLLVFFLPLIGGVLILAFALLVPGAPGDNKYGPLP